jgi:F-box/leucine-rich repeat protein 2/20
MERTYIWEEGEEDFNSMLDFGVNPQVKAVYFDDNILLNGTSLIKFSSICPNLQLLDLNACESISRECIVEVMKIVCKISHLNLAYTGIEKFQINFEVSQLKVLNLSGSRIEDESLSIISKCCTGLLFMDIQNGWYVTTKGASEIIRNCIVLKELNLRNCDLDGDFVCGLIFTRPSLRKLITPSGVDFYY